MTWEQSINGALAALLVGGGGRGGGGGSGGSGGKMKASDLIFTNLNSDRLT